MRHKLIYVSCKMSYSYTVVNNSSVVSEPNTKADYSPNLSMVVSAVGM